MPQEQSAELFSALTICRALVARSSFIPHRKAENPPSSLESGEMFALQIVKCSGDGWGTSRRGNSVVYRIAASAPASPASLVTRLSHC